jgi:hypothetical protein
VNGTGQALRRNSARVHHKAGKEAVVGLAVALQHNVCGGASSPHTRGQAEQWTQLILSFELLMCASSAPPRSRGRYIFGPELDSARALFQNQAHDRLWG